MRNQYSVIVETQKYGWRCCDENGNVFFKTASHSHFMPLEKALEIVKKFNGVLVKTENPQNEARI